MNISSPIWRHQIEIWKSGFPFQGHTPNVREPSDDNFRRNRVTIPNENVGSRPPLSVEPIFTNQRYRASIFVRRHQTQNSFQYLIWENWTDPIQLVGVTRPFLPLQTHSFLQKPTTNRLISKPHMEKQGKPPRKKNRIRKCTCLETVGTVVKWEKKKKEKLEKPKNFPETKKQGYWNQNEE